MKKTFKHIEGVNVVARFSKDRKYRYRLQITLQTGPIDGKTACVVMQNPSYADEDIADKSVQVMEKIVFLKKLPEFKDVRKLIVVNQFAFIQTKGFKGQTDHIGPENNSAIKEALLESDYIIIGWGTSNRFKERQGFVHDLVKQMNGERLFRTKMHPSRVRYAGFIQPY
jgi:hypothetical protein